MSFKLSIHHVRALAAVTAGAGLALIGLGGYVRATGAGLSCPDWPLCYGRLVPSSFEDGVAQEVAHRYLASAVSLLVVAFSAVSFLNRDLYPRLWRWCRLILLLLAGQVILGGLTVLLRLNPFIVTGHLAFGTLFVQLLALAAMDRPPEKRAREPIRRIDRRLPRTRTQLERVVFLLSALVYVQILLGGFVGSSGAALSCPGFPGCSKDVVIPWSGPQYVQMIHRLFALFLFLSTVATAVFARRLADDRTQRRGHLFGQAFMMALQMILGMSNVIFQLPHAVAVTHLLLTQLILFGFASYYRRLRPELSLYVAASHLADDDIELGEYTPTKRRFAASIR